jgi:hypothetical protein
VKKMIGRMVIAALLLAAGEGVRRAAAIEDRMAATQEQLATQAVSVTPAAYDLIENDLAFAARVPLVGTALLDDVRAQRAQAAYWTGDYATVAALASPPAATSPQTADADEDDPDLLFVGANASYRSTIQSRTDRAALLRGLDDVLKRYTEVLDAEPGHTGAAYNYEFVGRLRTALARSRQGDMLADNGTPNMHGEEGKPPQGTKPPEFNVIVPMRPDERQDQFDAGVGGVTRRRG